MNLVDVDGKSWITKTAKFVRGVFKGEGFAYAAQEIKEDYGVLKDSEQSVANRTKAAANILSQVLPLSIREGIDVYNYLTGNSYEYYDEIGNGTNGVSVIGPRATYRQFAINIGANFLNVKDDEWTWTLNEKFLNGIIQRGDDVIFAGKYNPSKLDKTSVLAKEIEYLEKNGYNWSKDYSKMYLGK